MSIEDISATIKSYPKEEIKLVEIISATHSEFADIVAVLDKKINPSNNIIYAHRPINQKTGEPMESSVIINKDDSS